MRRAEIQDLYGEFSYDYQLNLDMYQRIISLIKEELKEFSKGFVLSSPIEEWNIGIQKNNQNFKFTDNAYPIQVYTCIMSLTQPDKDKNEEKAMLTVESRQYRYYDEALLDAAYKLLERMKDEILKNRLFKVQIR